jgi:type 1 fimbria pilin
MRHLALFSGVALALCAPLSVMADDTANLKVTGTISPASCGVSLASGSEVNLGTVRLSDFKPGEDLKLEAKTASLSIACNGGPAFFRLRASDATGGVSDGSAHYGLGQNDQSGESKSNGYFELSIDAESMSANKFVLKSTDSGAGQAWASAGSGKVPFAHDDETFAFAADAAATSPVALASLTVPLKIEAVLAKDPTVNDEVELAGQATIEILY